MIKYGSVIRTRSQVSEAKKIASMSQYRCIYDFSDVESISSSVADELIAQPIVDDHARGIKIKNANEYIKMIISSTISTRIRKREIEGTNHKGLEGCGHNC